MKRREFITQTAGLGVVVAAAGAPGYPFSVIPPVSIETSSSKLTPPAKGKIPVAFAISEGATVIDFAGPWEVFQDVHVSDRGSNHDEQMPFQLFTVAEKIETITGSGGLKLVPDYTFENVPTPKVVVVPAQRGSQALHAWLRKIAPSTDLVMSVCTGAFQLGKAGLLNGKSATTHHEFLDRFAQTFPEVAVKRGLRFVEEDRISTAGGLSSGIDLALRVVDRYFGRDVAQATATYMEYQSKGWIA
ncbi:MAG TPA: DJ-1/PfpI family protein [Pyrinomonadaceae bacterium]|jgi:transcriptional regulator GlxA family with amidase domain|nr:DJ-1/PfpI family protein [Pyrinomonadaceae bacterium]